MIPLTGEIQTELDSYGGAGQKCGLVKPSSVKQLRELLAEASSDRRRITFRGGGCAFDTQSLNPDLIVSLEDLRGISYSPDATRVKVGAGERWGRIVRDAHARQRMPSIVVTTEQASAGGTASGNCVSRWSPLYGQDGDHIQAIELVTVAGEHINLSRPPTDKAQRNVGDVAFFGVIGGLGYLGAIVSVELKLIECPHDQVASEVVEVGAVRDVLTACLPPEDSTNGTTSYAVLMPDLRRGMAFQARYTSGQRLRRYRPVHQPRSMLRLVGEFLLRTHWGIRFIWWAGYRMRQRRFVDPILDYTFFMDGNVRTRGVGRRLGFDMALVQQSFVLPRNVDCASEFIERARRQFDDVGIVPMMADILYCPSNEALLSATHGLDGFVITFAFGPLTQTRHARAEHSFRVLSKACRELGGRVHLTKNVHADPDDLAAMYEATLPDFRRLKQTLDPEGLIRNPFLERVFPNLLCP